MNAVKHNIFLEGKMLRLLRNKIWIPNYWKAKKGSAKENKHAKNDIVELNLNK